MHSHPIELSVGLGFLLGMLHAIEPGHGKTAMFVYMLQQRRAFWHPIIMGLTTACSHAFSLAIIAAVVHFSAHWLAGDSHAGEQAVSQCLQWISSLLLIAIGLRLFVLAKYQFHRPKTCACCRGGDHGSQAQSSRVQSNDCVSQHTRHEDHSSHQALVSSIALAPSLQRTAGVAAVQAIMPDPASYSGPSVNRFSQLRLTLLLGFAIGLLPCPTALAAYFAGLSSGNPMEGYRIILVFSAGIAVSLAICGYILQGIGERLRKWLPGERSARRLAYFQAAVILLIGCFHLLQLYSGHAGHDH